MSLSISSDEFMDHISKDVQDLVLDTSVKVFNGIVSRTPVKTGQLRASWNMTKDAEDFSTIDEGTGLGPPATPDLSFKKGEYPLVFITNGKPYAEIMENGGSNQAPQGMVAVTLASL